MTATTSIHDAPTMLSGHAPRRQQPEPVALAETARPADDALATGPTLGSDPAGAAAPRQDLPARIGRYLVIKTLGAGGMGVVAEAFDPELDRRVALKLLRAREGAPSSHARLLREAQAMARLSHPNVVQVYDVGALGQQVYIAMELVDGQTLTAWQQAAPRGWRDIVQLYLEAGRGLAAAHAAGLVHRDFKPDNVLVGADGRVRVADFGLAREDRAALAAGEPLAGANPGAQALLAASLTATGAIMGTPIYMSPEQHRGAPAGPASDQFSFCVALYEALHGHRPFPGETMGELVAHVLTGEVLAPRGGPKIPARVDAAIRRGLAVRPEDRHPEFAALLAALEGELRRTGRVWLGGAAVALSAAALGWSLQPAAAAETCTGGQALVAAVWDEPARAALAQRFTGSDDGPRVQAGLDAYASAWAAAHGDACRDHQRGEHSSALLDLRMRCLEHRRHALATAVEVITGGDDAALGAATTVVAKLPPLAACEDLGALTAEVAPPDDPQVATDVEALRRRLVRAKVVADAGRLDDGLAEVAAVRERAKALAYRPLVAEAALVAGRLAVAGLRIDLARESLAEAFVTATATRQDAIAAEAKARQIFTVAQFDGRPDAALAERTLAEALVERAGGAGELSALLANNLGVLYAERGDLAAAGPLFRAAIDLGGDGTTDPIDLASGYLRNAAMTTPDPAERDRLFARADELLARALGPRHVSALQLRAVRARHAADPAAAVELLSGTCPAMHADPGAWPLCSECFVDLAELHVEAGRADAAVQALREAEACLTGELAAADPESPAQRAFARGRELLLTHRPGEALAELTTALAILEPHAQHRRIARWIADARLAEGEAQLALGRPEAAIPALERALALHEAEQAVSLASRPRRGAAQARVALAEALWQRGAPEARDRARALLGQAEAFYREVGDRARLDAIAGRRAAYIE